MLKKHFGLIGLSLFIFLFTVQTVSATLVSATISGTVIDDYNVPVANATIVLVNLTDNVTYTTTTSSLGYYSANVNHDIDGDFFFITAYKKNFQCNSEIPYVYENKSDVNLLCQAP